MHLRCPFCRATVTDADARWVCPRCLTLHHRECYRENGRCTILGCGGRTRLLPREPAEPGLEGLLALVHGVAWTVAALGLTVFVVLPARVDWSHALLAEDRGELGWAQWLLVAGLAGLFVVAAASTASDGAARRERRAPRTSGTPVDGSPAGRLPSTGVSRDAARASSR